MFYESRNSISGDMVKIRSGGDFSFPAHLHSSFELIFVTEGSMTVTIAKKQYVLVPGNGVLVFPNQVHSLHTPEHSRYGLCIFSAQLIQAYSHIYAEKVPASNEFALPGSVIDQLSHLDPKNRLQVKGFLYTLCGTFDATAQYQEREAKADGLLMYMFRFVEERLREDCSLEALAEQSGYHRVYLSRFFRQSTGLTYTDYVTRCRINEAAYLLRNTQQKMIDVAFSCGFNSLRSFNRSFRDVMGCTPSQYRIGA